jgi:putative inorganic carbon (HCO3(-)) transporter
MTAEKRARPNKPASSFTQNQWRELVILVLLVYNVFIGGNTYGLLLLYPRLLTQIIYFGLIALWLIGLLRHQRPFPRTPLDLPLVLLGGIIILATAFSVEPRLSLDDVSPYFIYVMIYYLVVDLLRTGWHVSAFLKGLVMTTVVVCVFAGLEYASWYLGLPLFPGFRQGWWSIGGWGDPFPPYWYRLSYTLNNPNILSALLALVLPIGVAVVIIARSRWTRVNAVAWLLINSLILLLTFSRGGILAALAGVLTLVWMVDRKGAFAFQRIGWPMRKRRLILVLGMAILVLAVVAGFFFVRELNRPVGYSIRQALWRYALQSILDHPLVGTGPRTFGTVIFRYWDPSQYPTAYAYNTAHNVLLHAGAEIGVLGALLIATIALLVIQAGYRQCKELPLRQSVLIAGFLSGLVAFGVHSIVDNLLAVPAVVLPAIVMAAVCSTQLDRRLAPSHSVLTPRRALLLTVIVAGLVIWSLYSQFSFMDIAADIQPREWSSVAERLDELPLGILPRSFHDFQRGLAHGKLGLGDSDSSAVKTAIAGYQDGLAKAPEYVPGRANLAALFWRMGDVTDARRELELAIEQEPDETLYRMNLGLLHEQQGEDAAATAVYAQILAEEPALASSIYWQGSDWRRRNWPLIRGETEARIDHMDSAEDKEIRKGILVYSSGDLSHAEDLFRSSKAATYSSAPDIWLGRILVEQGRFHEAVETLDGVLARSESASAYTSRARAHVALGDTEKAARDLRLALFWGDGRAQYHLGRLALAEGDVAKAIPLYRQSIPTQPSLTGANLRYDFLFYRQGGISESSLLPVSALPPDVSVAETYLELADLHAKGGDIEAAREICQELLALSPDYQPAIDKLGELEE